MKTEILIIISIVIAFFEMTKFQQVFFGDKKRMGYTYAAQERNAKLIGKYNSYIFIGIFLIGLFIFSPFLEFEKSESEIQMDEMFKKNDSIRKTEIDKLMGY